MADQAEERIEAALEALEGVAGPSAAAERARANRLLLQVEALEHQKDADDRSGSGSGTSPARTAPAPGAATTAPAAVVATTTRRAATVPAAAAAPGPARAAAPPGRGRGRRGPTGRPPAMTEPGAVTGGRRLGGRYRMETLLATGGMGEVWAAGTCCWTGRSR